MTPYNRLRQFPQLQTQQLQIPEPNPAPASAPLQWQPNIGGESEGDTQGLGDVSQLLGDYLKKRRAQSQPTLGDAPMPVSPSAA